MEKHLTVKNRKRLSRLKTEIEKLEAKAYKRDGMYSCNERFNNRYDAKVKEVIKLERLCQ